MPDTSDRRSLLRRSGCTCESAVMLALDCPVHGDDVKALVVDAIDDGRLIAAQPPGRCSACGQVAETRPYGVDGADVCHPCATATPEAEAVAKAAFLRRIGG